MIYYSISLIKTLRILVFSGLILLAVQPTSPAQTTEFEKPGISESLGDGIARFVAKGVKIKDLPHSFAIEKMPAPVGELPKAWKILPKFLQSEEQYAARIDIAEGTCLYGTGEIAGPLLRNGYVTETWNTDAWGYGRKSVRLYQSHPWVLAVRRDGSAYGVLADTAYRCTIDLSNGIKFSTAGHPFQIVVFTGDSPQEVLTRAADLMGTIPLPPKWALGYHQCRWSYYPDSRVREIADGFRDRNIPCDVIWLDIHYMDDYRIFTFHPEHFPDPKSTNAYLHERDFKSVWMIDPGVKKEPGYFIYDQGTKGNHWVLDANGNEYNGKVWPGMCAFPDFTRPETRKWWAGLYRDFMDKGIDGVWNDMNEPSVFGGPNKTMPEDNRHRGGCGIPPGPHAQYHNVYGMLMVRASREGILAAKPDKRPFILTRANFIGGHRYAATWTGDNLSTWDHLEDSVTMILNLGLSLQPFSGPDIGGFAGAGTPEQFDRWMGVGAFFPFSRGHTMQGNRNKEPWAYGPEVEASCRTALQRRYRLLPYLYTLFRESSINGLPVMRPVFFADITDPKLRAEDDAFLLGSDILVIPQLAEKADRQPAVPGGSWRTINLVGEDCRTDAVQPELRIRGGAIVPVGKVIQNTEQKSLDPLTLLVCLDEKGEAEGWLYEDAGDGFGYLEGDYLLTKYVAKREVDKIVVRISSEEGKMPRPARIVHVELITAGGVFKTSGKEKAGIVVK